MRIADWRPMCDRPCVISQQWGKAPPPYDEPKLVQDAQDKFLEGPFEGNHCGKGHPTVSTSSRGEGDACRPVIVTPSTCRGRAVCLATGKGHRGRIGRHPVDEQGLGGVERQRRELLVSLRDPSCLPKVMVLRAHPPSKISAWQQKCPTGIRSKKAAKALSSAPRRSPAAWPDVPMPRI